MKFVSNADMDKRLGYLVAAKQMESELAYTLNTFINTQQPQMLRRFFKDFSAIARKENKPIETMIFRGSLFMFDSQLGWGFPTAAYKAIADNSKIFSAKKVRENPYLNSVRLNKKLKIGDFTCEQESDKQYELFIYDIFWEDEPSLALPKLGMFDHYFEYPLIRENGDVWMTITPNEMETMQVDIDRSHGKVLTLGCGMGYFAFMSALKDDVDSVTIIEKSPDVIELFSEHILPQFEPKVRDKIKVVEADAFEYLKNLEDGVYDYCFVDIWKNNMDVDSYLKAKRLGNKFSRMEMAYWIEKHIVCSHIRGPVLMQMLKLHRDNIGDHSHDEGYLEYVNLWTSNAPDVLPCIEQIYKDVEIKTLDDLNHYTHPDTITALLGNYV